MTILVIAEHDNKVVAPATLNTVAAAAKIGGDIHVLVAGQGAAAVAEAAAKIAGVSKVLLVVEAVDTPKASGVTDSSGFFLAFMMFGRDA